MDTNNSGPGNSGPNPADSFFGRWDEPEFPDCPADYVLSAAASGAVPEAWAGHVAACPRCTSVVSALRCSTENPGKGLQEFMRDVRVRAAAAQTARKPSFFDYISGFY